MKVNSNRQNIFVLCCSFLIDVTISCNNQGQSNKEIVQAKNNNQPFESKIDTTILKYTTGVRSILEDSKGNIWFGSYNEGVCLLHNGQIQYFTTENGLSHNQVRTLLWAGNFSNKHTVKILFTKFTSLFTILALLMERYQSNFDE